MMYGDNYKIIVKVEKLDIITIYLSYFGESFN